MEQVRLAAATNNNVVTYPVVVTVDNSDGTLLPGLTVNAEIEVSKKPNVLKLANAALRFKPSDTSPLAQLQPQGPGQGGRAGGGMAEGLRAAAAGLSLNAQQQAVFDKTLEALQQRQAQRAAQASQQGGQQGGSRLFGGGGMRFGGPSSGGPDASMQAQMRARMRERLNQQFAAFRASLDDGQRARWDAALEEQLNAKRVTIYKLVDGKPQLAMVRVGASDGTATEVSGNIREGDEVISGERSAGTP